LLTTNYESICLWIYTERRVLFKYLVKGHKKRHKRPSGKKPGASKIPNRVGITERPAPVETRERAGHWEADTVVSRQSKVCAAVLVERKPRFFIAVHWRLTTQKSIDNEVSTINAMPILDKLILFKDKLLVSVNKAGYFMDRHYLYGAHPAQAPDRAIRSNDFLPARRQAKMISASILCA
jgi:hypothetical protein